MKITPIIVTPKDVVGRTLLKKTILAAIMQIDYDIYKSLIPSCSELSREELKEHWDMILDAAGTVLYKPSKAQLKLQEEIDKGLHDN